MRPALLLSLFAAGAASFAVGLACQSRPPARVAVAGPYRPPAPGARWYRGNTHTHTLWSDGDAAPELAVSWYRDHGYDFLVLSDHNLLQEEERWFPVREDGRLTPDRVAALQKRFGADRVELRPTPDGGSEMRLLTLSELRRRFEEPGRFLLVPGEEVTDRAAGRPVHVNGLNLAGFVPPQGGATVAEAVQRDLEAILAHGRAAGRPVLAHVNHPNFGWAFTIADLAGLRGERFFEVFNGHRGVNNHGGGDRPSTERMWDEANRIRLAETGLPPLYALATDDAHEYHGPGTSVPGRGWIFVRATELSAEAILAAMHAGDFYASTGVELADLRADDESFTVDVAAEPGVRYRTRFLGIVREPDGQLGTGVLLAETEEDPAVWRFRGDELAVRAEVISSRLHPDPFATGDHERAWTQPVIPPRR
ncbi:MAG: hypothetical protein D6702_06750 [Planctomycetota bacterium]|nr:MAG: hypothetical protein D6702_06750 [Planctomycetota bacterium]